MPEPELGPETKCDNRWHWDLTWTFPYCPSCESRERSPEAKALDARIAELEAKLAASDSERIAAQEECETLRSKIARWRPIARAAALYADRRNLPNILAPAVNDIVFAVDALSEPERAELLEEDGHG